MDTKIEESKLMENVDNKELNRLVSSYGHVTAFITLEGTAKELRLPDYDISKYENNCCMKQNCIQ